MANDPLTPTAEELAQARDVYAMVFHTSDTGGVAGNPMIEERAKIYALIRQYPEVAPLLGKLNLDAPRGFGSIDVGLPNDPTYVHVVMSPDEFLDFALRGEIALNQHDYPDYTGTERLRD